MKRVYEKSQALFARARDLIPGGVNSPVRAFRAVGGDPLFIAAGKGSRVCDVDGNWFIDYVGSYGPLLFGHAPDFVITRIAAALSSGTTFGAPTAGEIALARRIVECVPGIDMVRLVNSGGEAAAAVIRLARAVTGRALLVKCAGCYHGSVDPLLVDAGSGVATLAIPGTPGVPESTAAGTIVVPYNDVEALTAAFESHGAEIAAFLVEPIAGNMGLVPPEPGYLEHARALTRRCGALFIFDEVMTGFRVACGGAQELLQIKPDLTCLGKIIGGGVPVGAYGGSRALMNHVAPAGNVYQAGTLSGNPLATSAGLAVLEEIVARGAELYQSLERTSARLASGLAAAMDSEGIPATVNRAGSMLTLFLGCRSVRDYDSARQADTALFGRFFHAMLSRGIYLPPSQFECWFVSAAHTEHDIDLTIDAARESAREVARGL